MQGSDETEELTLEAAPAAAQRSREMVDLKNQEVIFERSGDPNVFYFLSTSGHQVKCPHQASPAKHRQKWAAQRPGHPSSPRQLNVDFKENFELRLEPS